jgi:ADP-heptose:LPS heptosyltransferase
MNGGIGDALLWTPALKAFEVKPDILYLYGTPPLQILKENNLTGNTFHIAHPVQLAVFALKNFKRYDRIFLNHLCGGNFLLRMMKKCGESLVTNSKNFIAEKKVVKKDILPGVHDALQNFFLAHDRTPSLGIPNFELKVKRADKFDLPQRFIALQLSAGNNKTPFKNWPPASWQSFLQLLTAQYPEQQLVVLGDKNEVLLADQIARQSNVISLAGKTTVDETFGVIAKSDVFIGLDGGLMHVAVAAGKPTFTIWGGSSPELYGYEQFSPADHKTVRQNMGCGPCNSWLNPNVTKTKDPMLCPDFACLYTLSPQQVFGQFKAFMNNKGD